jgi:hypothetical protein
MAPILKSLDDCRGLQALTELKSGDKIKVFCDHHGNCTTATAEIKEVDPHLYARMIVNELGVRYEHVGCLANLHIQKEERRLSAPARLETTETKTYFREFVPRKRSCRLTEKEFWDTKDLSIGDDAVRGGGGGSGSDVGDDGIHVDESHVMVPGSNGTGASSSSISSSVSITTIVTTEAHQNSLWNSFAPPQSAGDVLPPRVHLPAAAQLPCPDPSKKRCSGDL